MAFKGLVDVPFFIIAGRPLAGLMEKWNDKIEVVTEQVDGAGETTDRHESVEEDRFDLSFDAWYSLGGTGDAIVGSTAASTTYAANTATDGAAWDLSAVTPGMIMASEDGIYAIITTVNDAGDVLTCAGGWVGGVQPGDAQACYVFRAGDITGAMALTGPQPSMYALEGNTLADPVVMFESVRAKYTKLMAQGKLHRIRADFKSDKGPDYGVILAPYAVVTGAGPTEMAGHDWGVGFADDAVGGLMAMLQVTELELDGGTDFDVRVQQSPNNAGYVDLIAFTVVAAVPGSERKFVAAADAPGAEIERWTTVRWAWGGAPGAARHARFVVGCARSLTMQR